MADEMMVLIRFGGNADDLLPRYLGAVTRWREDDATKNFSPPLMAAHTRISAGKGPSAPPGSPSRPTLI